MIKYVLSMVSACEFVHSRDKSFVCSVLNYYDALTPAISGIFFILVKQDIFPLYLLLVASSIVALLTILILNLETPRWLLHNGRTSEAIDTLNYIAWFNGVEGRIPQDSVFLEAVSGKEMGSPKSTA